MLLQPYLFFGGRCAEAVAFYREAVGAEVEMMMRFRDAPDPPPPGMVPPDWDDKVMHASLRIGGSAMMLSDGGCAEQAAGFSGFSLSLNARDAAEAGRVFARLAEGGTVTMPLGATFFSPCFGTLTDRFGVGWMVVVLPAGGGAA